MFVPLKEVPTHDMKRAIIANSTTISVGDLIVPDATNTAVVVDGESAVADGLGVVLSIINYRGGSQESQTVTVAADNVTVARIGVEYVPCRLPIEYTADLDAAAGTTSGSAGFGSFSILSTDAGVLDESSYLKVNAGGYPLTFNSLGVTSYSTTKVTGYFRLSV